MAYQHISEPPANPSSLNAKVSPALDAVVLYSLNKDKFERYQTASEFRSDLETAGAGEVPARRLPANGVNSTLFGINPSTNAGSEATLRQLTADDERSVRTQPRPPVAWIWAGVALMAAVLITVGIWVVRLPEQQAFGDNLSVTVPDIVGTTDSVGKEVLTQEGLMPVQFGQASDTIAEDIVISTDPSAGTKVSPDQPVKVYVSAGRNPTTVPRLDALSEADATKAIAARNLALREVNTDYSTTVPAGFVISSSPQSNAQVREGAEIDLVVSNGLVQIPTVVGQPINTANTTLGALLLQINAVQDAGCTGGAVTTQSLALGDHPQGSSITLTYCTPD